MSAFRFRLVTLLAAILVIAVWLSTPAMPDEFAKDVRRSMRLMVLVAAFAGPAKPRRRGG